MLAVFARQIKPLGSQKVGYRAGLTALMLLAGAGAVRDATALNETRTLSFHHTHSGEDLTVTFKRNGRYDEEALKQLNHLLRDWRNQEKTEMDRRLFDILWEVYRDVDGKQPINIISSYRSPATNAMLRRRSSGVARHSQHMLGHAIDFFIPGVALEQIRYAGLRQQRGGVGFYPTSGSHFVHLDTGSVRHWPRMTYAQLSKVFPDGRTVHLPSNGGPMKGYELARADIERRGNGDDAATVGKMPNLFASLFKSGKPAAEEDDEGASAPARNDKPASAGAMAAAAVVELSGGTPDMIGNAVAIAIKNTLGLVCDPVAGLVEIPCIKRNASGVSNAFVAAELALSGIKSAIPADETITAMKSVGESMQTSLKETGEGGLAATPTGLRIYRQLFGTDAAKGCEE